MKIEEVETNSTKNNTCDLYTSITLENLGTWRKIHAIRTENGDLLLVADEQGKRNIFKKYFQKFLNEMQQETEAEKAEINTVDPLIKIPKCAELVAAVKQLKNTESARRPNTRGAN